MADLTADNDADYRDEPTTDEHLPELADPAAVPADEGDAGKPSS